MKNNYIQTNTKNYGQIRKSIGICNHSDMYKLTIYGPDASKLINSFSIKALEKIKNNSFYTIFMNKKRYLSELQIIVLSPIKYLLIYENPIDKKKKGINLLKIINKAKRKFPLVTIENSTGQYSFFSFHGDKANEYFELNKSSSLYRVNRQGYIYYTLITSIVNKFSVLDHFKNIGFMEINKDNYLTFLHNHKVLTNLERIPRRLMIPTFQAIYFGDNYKFKHKCKAIEIKQFESTKNLVVTFKMYIYNSKRKKIGYVHNFYRLATKKNPFLLCLIKKDKADLISLLRNNKNEIIVKEYYQYN